jgi:hypothetical protein
MRPKLPDASSQEPLKYLQLSGSYNVLGFVCTRIEYDPLRANHAASSIYRAKSLVLTDRGSRAVIDGAFIMPVNSGLIVGWEVAQAENRGL